MVKDFKKLRSREESPTHLFTPADFHGVKWGPLQMAENKWVTGVSVTPK